MPQPLTHLLALGGSGRGEGGGEGPGSALGHAGCPQGNITSICLPSVQKLLCPGTCPCPGENLTLWPCISSLPRALLHFGLLGSASGAPLGHLKALPHMRQRVVLRGFQAERPECRSDPDAKAQGAPYF